MVYTTPVFISTVVAAARTGEFTDLLAAGLLAVCSFILLRVALTHGLRLVEHIEIERRVQTDPLTGFLNGAGFQKQLDRALEPPSVRAAETGNPGRDQPPYMPVSTGRQAGERRAASRREQT